VCERSCISQSGMSSYLAMHFVTFTRFDFIFLYVFLSFILAATSFRCHVGRQMRLERCYLHVVAKQPYTKLSDLDSF
jgi:hypothetical protein